MVKLSPHTAGHTLHWESLKWAQNSYFLIIIQDTELWSSPSWEQGWPRTEPTAVLLLLFLIRVLSSGLPFLSSSSPPFLPHLSLFPLSPLFTLMTIWKNYDLGSQAICCSKESEEKIEKQVRSGNCPEITCGEVLLGDRGSKKWTILLLDSISFFFQTSGYGEKWGETKKLDLFSFKWLSS